MELEVPRGGSVGFLLSQLGYATSRGFRDQLAPHGLEPRQFAMLQFIGANEGRSQQTIGDAVQIPASRMVSLVDDLEQRGLLERRQDPSDRRARALFLTAQGHRIMREAWTAAMEFEGKVCAGLTAEARRELIDRLEAVAANFGLVVGVHPELTGERAGWEH